jgi:hypothetical protein
MFDAREDELSFVSATAESLQIRYTLEHPRIHFDHYHADVIRIRLTQNLRTLMPDLLDELNTALNDDFANVNDGKFHFKFSVNDRLDTLDYV